MENSTLKISIIIPVYNAEKYISRCVESLLRQSASEYEVILVDDGSSDGSLQLCEKYAALNDQVRVIHQENKGVSTARNTGINAASGEYIGFVDVDDFIRRDMFQVLLEEAEQCNAEIVLCDSLAVSKDGGQERETIVSLGSGVFHRAEIAPSALLEMAGAVWRCIYRRSLIKNNGIQFPVGLKISEDRIFNLYAMGYANKIAYVKEALYFRTLNEESAVHRYHADYLEIVEHGRIATIKAIEQAWENKTEFQNCYKRQYVEGCLNAIENEKRLDAQHSFWKRYREIRSICSNSKLVDAIAVTNYQQESLRCKWILQKRYFILSLSNQKVFRKAESGISQIQKDGICNYVGRLVRKVLK